MLPHSFNHAGGDTVFINMTRRCQAQRRDHFAAEPENRRADTGQPTRNFFIINGITLFANTL